MLYANIDVHFPDDPKVAGLHPVAELAYLRIVLRSRQHLTDGVMDRRVYSRWLVGIELDDFDIGEAIDQLVDAGLLEICDAGVRIPARVWRKWNPTAEEVGQMREKKRQASDLGNHTRWHVNEGKTDPNCSHCAIAPDSQPDPTCDPPAKRVGSPKPEPKPERETEGKPLTRSVADAIPPATAEATDEPAVSDDGFEDFWQKYPRRDGIRQGKANAHAAWKRLRVAERERVLRALAVYVTKCGDKPKDAQRFLGNKFYVDYLPETIAADSATPRPTADAGVIVRNGRRYRHLPGSGLVEIHDEPADWEQ